MNRQNLFIPIVLFVLVSCNSSEEKKAAPTNSPTQSFIRPPLKNVDVPFEEYQIDAAKGDTLFPQTCSIILFPPNAFIDKAGNVISGNVQVRYREFTEPIDFFLSGIPMDYDSAGKKMNFESAGMCEVLAFKDGQPVFVNPKSKPEVNLLSNSKSPDFNLYYLDTVQQKWIVKEGQTVTVLEKGRTRTKPVANNSTKRDFTYKMEDIVKPVKPEKATNKGPVLKIVIDPTSFKELMAYDNLRFQLDEKENRFSPEDSKEEWNTIDLQKADENGLYTLKFTNVTRTVTYKARPVFEGQDYEKALKVFEEKNQAYQKKLAEMLAKQKQEKADQQKRFLEDSLDNEKRIAKNKMITDENIRIERLNYLTAIRNGEIEKQNEVTRAKNKKRKEEFEAYVVEQKRLQKVNDEKIRAEIEKQKQLEKQYEDNYKAMLERQARIANENSQVDEVVRAFQLEGFGIWNCDFVTTYPIVSVNANFQDSEKKKMDLTNVTVVCKNLNSISRFYSNRINLRLKTENMIFGVDNGLFAFIKYGEYGRSNTTTESQNQAFVMTVVKAEQNNYAYLKSLFKGQ